MLRRENDLRVSTETQHAFKAVARMSQEGRKRDAYLKVVDDLQKQVAAEFGLSEKVGLDALRSAELLLNNNPQDVIDVREISLYRKYNRCRDGDLSVGDAPPDARLVRVLDQDIHRVDPNASVHGVLSSSSLPTVLLVGSYT